MARRLLLGLTAAAISAAPALAQTVPLPAPVPNPSGQTPTVTPSGAASKTPVIDISKANDKGVSHNVYTNFDVGPEGLVLNNSTTGTETSVLNGTTLWKNTNLEGKSARLILNEVTGASLSQLLGYTEVYGQSAEFILANPNGIACRGCGFINTPRVTLSTGKPLMGADGSFLGFDVDKGHISFERGTGPYNGAYGADVTGVQYFDVIARSIMVSGQIKGNNTNTEIGIYSGRNKADYNASGGTNRIGLTAKTDPAGSAAPEFGIDSTMLGGAYAHKITLIATETGAGIRAPAEMTAAYGGIDLTADGKIVIGKQADGQSSTGKTQSAGRIQVTSTAGDIEIAQTVWSQTALELTAGAKISVLDNIKASAQGDVTLKSASLDLGTGALAGAGLNEDGTLTASGLLTVEAAALTNRGTLQAARDVNITVTGSTTNYAGGRMLSGGTLALLGGSVFSNDGLVSGDAGVRLATANAANAGTIRSTSGAVQGSIGGTFANAGAVDGLSVDFTVTAALSNTGTIISAASTKLTSASLDNGGSIGSQGTVNLTTLAGDLTNRNTITGQTLRLDANGALVNISGASLTSTGGMTLRSASLDNSGSIGGATIDATAAGLIANQAGSWITSTSGTTLTGGSLENSGELRSQGTLAATVSGGLTNRQTISGQTVTLDAGGALVNTSGASIAASAGANLKAGSLANAGTVNGQTVGIGIAGAAVNTGAVTSTGSTGITAGSLSNTGTLESGGQLTADIAGDLNNGDLASSGRIIAGTSGNLTVGGTLTNHLGSVIRAGETLTIGAASLQNNGAVDETLTDGLITAGGLVLTGGDVQNAGNMLADRDFIVTVSGSVENVFAEMYAGNVLNITAGQKIRNVAGRMHAGGKVNLNAPDVENVELAKRETELIVPPEYKGLLKQEAAKKIEQALNEYQTAITAKFKDTEDKVWDAVRKQFGEQPLDGELRKKLETLLKTSLLKEDGLRQAAAGVNKAIAGNGTPGQIALAASGALRKTYVRPEDTRAAAGLVTAALKDKYGSHPRFAGLDGRLSGIIQAQYRDDGSAAVEAGIYNAVQGGQDGEAPRHSSAAPAGSANASGVQPVVIDLLAAANGQARREP